MTALTERDVEFGVQVTRNGFGTHIGTWSRGGLKDLTDEEVRTLIAKLTVALGDRAREISDSNVADIMETAAYGGISYWATSATTEDFAAAPEGTVATIRDGEEDKVYHLSAEDVRLATVKILVNDPRVVNETIQGYVADAFKGADEAGIDCGYIDADAADCIVQLACFDEITYG